MMMVTVMTEALHLFKRYVWRGRAVNSRFPNAFQTSRIQLLFASPLRTDAGSAATGSRSNATTF